MATARLPVVAIDCPDPGDLARFYGAILDWPVDVDGDDLDEREDAVVALGAVKHEYQPARRSGSSSTPPANRSVAAWRDPILFA